MCQLVAIVWGRVTVVNGDHDAMGYTNSITHITHALQDTVSRSSIAWSWLFVYMSLECTSPI